MLAPGLNDAVCCEDERTVIECLVVGGWGVTRTSDVTQTLQSEVGLTGVSHKDDLARTNRRTSPRLSCCFHHHGGKLSGAVGFDVQSYGGGEGDSDPNRLRPARLSTPTHL